MKRMVCILSLAGLLLLLMTAGVLAAAPGDLRATKTASQQTTLTWTPGTGSNYVEYSLDGLTWTQAAEAGAGFGVRLDPSAASGKSKVIGLTDFTNYYFRIRNVDGVTTFSNTVVAFPPDEHAHMYFASDTNMCSRCHSTHLGAGEKLLKQTTLNDVCKTCHTGGTGSKYQVDFGKVTGAGGTRLEALAGFFGTDLVSGPGLPVPTWTHPLGRLLNMAPGGNPGGEGAWEEKLTCGTCHTAHSANTYQYRLLRTALPNMTLSGARTVLPTLTVEAYSKTGSGKEDAVYVSGMNNFCGGCHADYNTLGVNGSGHTRSGIYTPPAYRHAVGKDIGTNGLTTTLPLEAVGAAAFLSDGSQHSSGTVFCITCHKPHGVNTTPVGKLLRLNNRSVCENCHQM